MKRIHIVGRKNQGKTTLLCELVAELTSRGWNVGTIKHTHHSHELDIPGKDSYRHRTAGAHVAGIISRETSAVFWNQDRHDGEAYDRFQPMFADCDVVLVEGDLQADAIKLEVWRAEMDQPPYAATDDSIHGVITDDPCNLSIKVLPRSVPYIADYVAKVLREKEQ